MANTPESYEPLVQLLEDAADGARDHAVAAKLKQNLEPDIRADLVNLAGKPAGPANVPPAVPGTKALWNAAKARKIATSGAFRSAISSGKSLAKACIGVLKLRLGDQWNSTWNAAGFTNGSLAMPENPMVLLQQFRAYFVANPTHEVATLTPTISATAAACETAAQAISTAATVSNQANSDAGTAKKNLADAIAAGRARVGGLRSELDQTLSDDDPLWYAFGFDRPSDPKTPEVPVNLIVTVGSPGSGMIFADWDDSRRAESYRVIVSNTAVPPVEIASKLVTESEATITGLPAGAFQVVITAINEAGESQPGAAVSGMLL